MSPPAVTMMRRLSPLTMLAFLPRYGLHVESLYHP